MQKSHIGYVVFPSSQDLAARLHAQHKDTHPRHHFPKGRPQWHFLTHPAAPQCPHLAQSLQISPPPSSTAIIRWNDARVTRKALSQLTVRELNDIGLAAGDIERIARR